LVDEAGRDTVHDAAGQVVPPVDAWAPPVRQRRRKPATLVIGLVLVGLVVGVALISLFWTPYDPVELNVLDRLLPPGSDGYLFGTEKLGRDVVTQIMVGARTSLLVSLLATSVAVLLGTLWGLMAAGSNQRWQSVLTRTTDVGVALPGILFALVLATVIGPGITAAVVAIIVWFTPIQARITIGPARQVLSLDYVEAASAHGRSRWFILVNHVLPNISSLLIVQASVMFAVAILIEAALSFLGVGAQPPTASWGRLLKEAQPLLEVAPTLMIFPGVAIVIAVLGFNLLGDGLRTVLDPHESLAAKSADA
jgi:peptide/nickel transport system permease protein